MSDKFGMPIVGTDKEVIAYLRQQLAEAKKLHEDYRKFMAGAEQDVRRYRWLRKRGISLTGSTRGWRSDEYLDKHIDAAIDQAMREGE